MSTVLRSEKVTGPLGTFRISTVKTLAGGGANDTRGPFSDADYVDETPWPFEVMVFREVSITGLYHAPLASESEAIEHHALMVETIRKGLEFGGGVQGQFGTPSVTAQEWRDRMAAKGLGT
ncbi:MAG: hypothetical protein LAO20_14235 [Acidobacteriia bacterium]|nr:hypothetical protein [Terriglobia bacterium]